MSAEALPMLTQFGVAGLIAAMWLVERRASSAREKQLTDAHDRLMESRQAVEALLTVVKENTRAITALEAAVARLGREGASAERGAPERGA